MGRKTKFDQKTINHLKYYVYMLLNEKNQPFYVGKGKNNRVFEHIKCALKEDVSNNKYDKIREIEAEGGKVQHSIVRHGLSEDTAFDVETALLDTLKLLEVPVTNLVSGRHSFELGLMSTEDIISKYNAEPLNTLQHPSVIININKSYKKSNGDVYQATKEAWVIGKDRRKTICYALSEYKGFIAEVFKIKKWYPVEDHNGKERWGFCGSVAPDEVRNCYIKKSIAHIKKPGASNPIRYNISTAKQPEE